MLPTRLRFEIDAVILGGTVPCECKCAPPFETLLSYEAKRAAGSRSGSGEVLPFPCRVRHPVPRLGAGTDRR